MPVARTRSIALVGLAGSVVEVEADLSSQLPAFVIIGLPDAALGEARERVRSAATNAGCPLPSRRLTVNLSPAALPKAPLRDFQSVGLTPDTATRTSTSPSAGSSGGRCTSCSTVASPSGA